MYRNEKIFMDNALNKKLNGLEQTNGKILEILESLRSSMENSVTKTEFNEFKNEMSEFKTETEEKFEFLIKNAATKTELESVRQDLMKTVNIRTSKLSDKIDAKISDLKSDINKAIRGADKHFHKFAV